MELKERFNNGNVCYCETIASLQQQFTKIVGFGLNLKMVLYFQNRCLPESLGFLNQPHHQAAARRQQPERKTEK